MSNFIYDNLKKLKEKKIPNPEIDLRILLNFSKRIQNEIILTNFDLKQINLKIFNLALERRLATKNALKDQH